MSRGFREKIAVSLFGAALVMGAVLGVMAIRSFTQPTTELATAAGQVSGSQANAGPAEMPGAPGTGGSSSGGSGGVSGGTITIGGFFDITGPVDSSVERDTVRAYMQAVNASGGINGRQVQYVWCDSTAEYSDPLSFPVSANFYRYGGAIADEARALSVKHPAVVVLGDVGTALAANRVPLAFMFLTLEALLLASAAAWVWARSTPADAVPDEVLAP
jgi:hypothetical protein